MNRDQIERLLRQPGLREAGYVPTGLPASPTDVQHRPARMVFAVARAAAFAAAVAAGVVIAMTLTRGPNAPGPGIGPGSTPPASAAPSTSPELASCRSGDFAWSVDAWGGFAGGRGTSVLAKVVSSVSACTINGPARLVLNDANGVELATIVAPATRLTLHADEAVEMGVTWSNWCNATSPALPVSLSVTLFAGPPVTLTPEAGAGIPGCSGGSATSLGATNFQPTTRSPQG